MSLETFRGALSSKLYTLAIRSIQKKRYWISKGLLQLVVKLSPKNYKAWGYLGNIYRRKHNLKKAEQCYRISIDLDPHVTPIFYAASQENRRYALRKSNLRLQDLTFAHKP
jgi:Tfp pilus assembly protein PilF